MERAKPQVETFDPVATVASYRRAVEHRDSPETPEPDRDEFALIAKQLRERWAAWQGEDSLHEMAFSEPTE